MTQLTFSQDLPTLLLSDTGEKTLSLMNHFQVDELPITDPDLQYIGLVSATDLIELNRLDLSLDLYPNEWQCPSVQQETPFTEMLNTMKLSGHSMLPIVDDKGKYIGALSYIDLLANMVNLPVAQETGSIIVLEINNKDYVLSDIARIAEANNTIIISLLTINTPINTMHVAFKVNKVEIDAILQTFERYNYQVIATRHEKQPEYLEDVETHYHALMNYLSV